MRGRKTTKKEDGKEKCPHPHTLGQGAKGGGSAQIKSAPNQVDF